MENADKVAEEPGGNVLDVVALGVAPGPEVGRLLEAAERWWVDGDFRATRAQCLARLEELIGEAD